MPLYDFKCRDGHKIEVLVKFSESGPVRCPVFYDPQEPTRQCNAAMERVFPIPARVFPGAASWRE